jgi:hypothetical protein
MRRGHLPRNLRRVTRTFHCAAQRRAAEPVFGSDRYRAGNLDLCESAVGRYRPSEEGMGDTPRPPMRVGDPI